MTTFSLIPTISSLVDHSDPSKLGSVASSLCCNASSDSLSSISSSVPSSSSTILHNYFYIRRKFTTESLNTVVAQTKSSSALSVFGILVQHAAHGGLASFEGEAMKQASDTGLWPETVSQWSSSSVNVNDNKYPYLTLGEQTGDEAKPASDLEECIITPADALNTFAMASLRSIISITSPCSSFTFHVLEEAPFTYPPLSQAPCVAFESLGEHQSNASTNIPTRECWDRLWRTWDLITLEMIPSDMLLQKPIELRHKCLFYIGHIPTFLDMMLCKTLGGGPSEPKHFWEIFERGIDPHVDDPDHCHNHSAVPEADEDWPTLEDIIGFRNQVRSRLDRLYDELQSGKRAINLAIARTLVMTYEHEAFHIETILYMLIQRAGTGTRPPPGFTRPIWSHLVPQWNASQAQELSPLPTLGPATIFMGHDDSEGDDYINGVAVEGPHRVVGREFGWDNESPSRSVKVGKFKAEWRPISNGEFEVFWRNARGSIAMPTSWVKEGEQIKVRTVYGPVSMDIARHWPVMTSYDDLLAYAKSKGGRLPTEPELRYFFDTYDVGYDGGANIGFRSWHPSVSTMGLKGTDCKGSNGGVWEWSSTLFDGHEGLVPTNLFTGYSTDFFDGKHHVVVGASYATLPRLTRRTVRNFYQHNYPYPWVGARVVYDA